jgi:hypothetical protein
MPENERKDQNPSDMVRIDLTQEQKDEAKERKEKDTESAELGGEELEQRIAPIAFQ